ncbi:hypothetical protein BDV98DRAFT_536882, partial [Pterulicium gracile]
MVLIRLVNMCMQFGLDHSDVDKIEQSFVHWVEVFERIYFQGNPGRARISTMPIHALLHLAQDIHNMGPLWVYWCFVMEHFCGSLPPAVKSRKHPETNLANRLRDLAQNSQIELIYQLHDTM